MRGVGGFNFTNSIKLKQQKRIFATVLIQFRSVYVYEETVEHEALNFAFSLHLSEHKIPVY